jgi:hypothetical protein
MYGTCLHRNFVQEIIAGKMNVHLIAHQHGNCYPFFFYDQHKLLN